MSGALERGMESGVLSMYVRISLPGTHKCFRGPLNLLELYKNHWIMWICTLFLGESLFLPDLQRGLCPLKDEKPLICHISSDLSYTY